MGDQTPQMKKLMLLSKEIGLLDHERIELSQIILRRDITSWRQLDDEQVRRMLDALEGYEKITALLDMRF